MENEEITTIENSNDDIDIKTDEDEEKTVNRIKKESLDEYRRMTVGRQTKSWIVTLLLVGTLILIVMTIATIRKTNITIDNMNTTERIEMKITDYQNVNGGNN